MKNGRLSTVMASEDLQSPQSASGCVSAVVISYFTGPILSRALEALAVQPEIKEIILVDNGNFDGHVEKAINDKASPLVRVVSGHGNIGFARGCNLGAKACSGEHLLIINPDAVMPEGGVAQLLRDSTERERPWLMGAKLVGPDGMEQQGSRRRVLTPWRAFVEITRLYKLAPEHPYFKRFNMHTDECPGDVSETPVISGAIMFLPKANYDLVGGMDERYFLHVEDIDFCLRFAKNGGRVFFNPHVSVLHYKSSSRANPIMIEARKTQGIIRYFHTHFSKAYPKPFLWLVDAALWIAFGLLFVKRAVLKTIRLAGFRARRGGRGVERAKSLSRRQSMR
ncbi:glycosyltransferase family 2 protein [Hyphococcus flavus]|uniref:Glycosyltransferase family 2 protein n=1 Tax=Hyphococcus flavus TaxID=1866326 RepID=A0AAE9ZCW9_9PROT|nr:glycosyltransferase family 2 protein [Hyphococcus flavus]WDI32574.1 glycosyltransferase family 2 protein [Hyphococcus flavus]